MRVFFQNAGKTEYLYARIMESARLAVEVLVPLFLFANCIYELLS